MTTFKSALAICGLSHQQAAEYLDISIQSVKVFSQGKRGAPIGVWALLAALYERIQDAADFASDRMAIGGIDPRAYGQIEADTGDDPLPEGSDSVAGAMALLMAVTDQP